MASDVGGVSAIDAATGRRIWQERVEGIFAASPVAGDGKIYFVSETGQTIVLRAGRHPENSRAQRHRRAADRIARDLEGRNLSSERPTIILYQELGETRLSTSAVHPCEKTPCE
jgi:hypothetical protein